MSATVGSEEDTAVVDPHADRVARLRAAVLGGPGALSAATRRSLADGAEAPAPLPAYAEKVRESAHTITGEDVAALLAAGLSEAGVFEATVSAAFGAAHRRLEAGLRALRDAETGRASALR